MYQRDDDGNIVYIEVDGEQIPVEIGTVAGYNNPVSFYANIAMSGGEAEAKEYGFDSSAYEAVLVTTDKSLPISETSRIWHTSRPQYNDDGTVNGDSADYSVLAVKPSLNAVKYLLKNFRKVENDMDNMKMSFEDMISALDGASGRMTTEALKNPVIREAKEMIMKVSISLGEWAQALEES